MRSLLRAANPNPNPNLSPNPNPNLNPNPNPDPNPNPSQVAPDDASAHAAFTRLFTHLRSRPGAAT